MAGARFNAALPKEGEADDISFIRTVYIQTIELAESVGESACCSCLAQEDVVCLLCSSGDGTRRGYLAADGFGSEFCYLEPETRGEVCL